jgi:signal transduction histidine kinase
MTTHGSPGTGSTGRFYVRTERVLAVGRAFLTVTALVAIYLDPTEPTRLQSTTYAVLLGYAVYSLAILATVNAATRMGGRQALVLHGLDMLWTSVLTAVSEGPVSPFFLFFLFVVVASAYRWGLRETLATTVVTIVIFLVETALAASGPLHAVWLGAIDFELNRTILRVAYLLLTGVLLGYLAQQQKASQAELAVVAAAARQSHISLGLGGSVTALARTLRSAFRASAVVVVVRDAATSRVLQFRLAGASEPATIRRSELTTAAAATWLFPDFGRAWLATLGESSPGARQIRSTEPDAWRLKRQAAELPDDIAAFGPFSTVSVVNLGLAHEWQARAYLFDVSDRDGSERHLHFLEDLADHMTPGLTNVFLMRRLRARAGAAERARVARELHDGSIQALFGIEMKLEAIRRESNPAPAALDAELTEIQELIRHEVHALRDLMQALRPIEIDSAEPLGDVLAGIVERFRRDTGISARFVSGGERVVLPAERALELVRIVQEALVNVRKHSQAGNVLVRLTADPDGRCALLIEDDGRGFGFEGRLASRDLEARRIGPAMIKERARLASADLAVDSTPGAGARIELTFSQGA